MPSTPPPQRSPRKRPFKHRRKGLHRRKHHLSVKGLAKLRLALRARAAWRKAHGIRIHHRFHHRKPMTLAQHQHFAQALRTAAARRKALGLHRHLSPVARARLIARLRARHHRGPHKAAYRIKATHTRRLRGVPQSRFRIKRVRMSKRKPH